jgi:type II secretory pathway pseudopilin PulG
MSASKFLLKSLLKQPRRQKSSSGFTLLELLVGMILTFLIITPLLGFVVSLMNTDRQEQAKNASQQDIQAALDYMAQDLQQAVYIYDASALANNSDPSDPTQSGIKDQIPPVAQAPGCDNAQTCVPVLAFWKRKFLDKNDVINNVKIGDIQDSSPGSDKFVYSLVVYYLIKDNSSNWSPVARIGRFEIRDGIPDPTSNSKSPTYLLPADDGFASFDLSAGQGNVQYSMNLWQKSPAAYTQQVVTLVDYIDDTPSTALSSLPQGVQNQFTPPTNDSTSSLGNLISTKYGQLPGITACADRTGGAVPAGFGTPALPGSSRVPPDPIPAALNTGSFYACVNPLDAQGQSVVQVFLRGNALPRLNTNPQTWAINAGNVTTQLSNRPIANVRIAVRGLLNSNNQ